MQAFATDISVYKVSETQMNIRLREEQKTVRRKCRTAESARREILDAAKNRLMNEGPDGSDGLFDGLSKILHTMRCERAEKRVANRIQNSTRPAPSFRWWRVRFSGRQSPGFSLNRLGDRPHESIAETRHTHS